jgi:hypothetical protein
LQDLVVLALAHVSLAALSRFESFEQSRQITDYAQIYTVVREKG